MGAIYFCFMMFGVVMVRLRRAGGRLVTRRGQGLLSRRRIRSAILRPSRSSNAITGRPVREPRTGRPGLGIIALYFP